MTEGRKVAQAMIDAYRNLTKTEPDDAKKREMVEKWNETLPQSVRYSPKGLTDLLSWLE